VTDAVFVESFARANQVVHSVESQWHYRLLVPYGFIPVQRQAVGLVRGYDYVHSDGRSVRCCTGANADYWTASDGKTGYWATLEEWAKTSALSSAGI
jgi:hypothetical protein